MFKQEMLLRTSIKYTHWKCYQIFNSSFVLDYVLASFFNAPHTSILGPLKSAMTSSYLFGPLIVLTQTSQYFSHMYNQITRKHI